MSIDRWVDEEDVLHLYNGILLSHKKSFSATWMQLESIILSETRKRRDKYHMIPLIHGYKVWHKWNYLWKVVVKGEGVRGGIEWKVVISRCKLLYINWINKVLLHSTENSIQYPMINHNRKEYFKRTTQSKSGKKT